MFLTINILIKLCVFTILYLIYIYYIEMILIYKICFNLMLLFRHGFMYDVNVKFLQLLYM